MTNLKPCPFCGNTVALRVLDANEIDYLDRGDANWEDEPYYQVVCCYYDIEPLPTANWKRGCGSSCGFHPTKKQAIEAWNRRADDV